MYPPFPQSRGYPISRSIHLQRNGTSEQIEKGSHTAKSASDPISPGEVKSHTRKSFREITRAQVNCSQQSQLRGADHPNLEEKRRSLHEREIGAAGKWDFLEIGTALSEAKTLPVNRKRWNVSSKKWDDWYRIISSKRSFES